jgi:hypothetical protein
MAVKFSSYRFRATNAIKINKIKAPPTLACQNVQIPGIVAFYALPGCRLVLRAGSYSFVFRVLIPNGRYSGQKLKRLVKMKTPAKISKRIAIVPEIMLAK